MSQRYLTLTMMISYFDFWERNLLSTYRKQLCFSSNILLRHFPFNIYIWESVFVYSLSNLTSHLSWSNQSIMTSICSKLFTNNLSLRSRYVISSIVVDYCKKLGYVIHPMSCFIRLSFCFPPTSVWALCSLVSLGVKNNLLNDERYAWENFCHIRKHFCYIQNTSSSKVSCLRATQKYYY